MRSSCIQHPANEPLIVVRKWQMAFCEGDRVAAALLSFLEYWHNIKLEMAAKNKVSNDIAEAHGKARNQDESLWQFHTEKELEDGILIFKATRIGTALESLVKKGVVEVSKNPNPKLTFDRTRYFMFKPQKINDWLIENYRSVRSADSTVKSAARSGTNAAPSGKSAAALTETSAETSSKRDIAREREKDLRQYPLKVNRKPGV